MISLKNWGASPVKHLLPVLALLVGCGPGEVLPGQDVTYFNHGLSTTVHHVYFEEESLDQGLHWLVGASNRKEADDLGQEVYLQAFTPQGKPMTTAEGHVIQRYWFGGLGKQEGHTLQALDAGNHALVAYNHALGATEVYHLKGLQDTAVMLHHTVAAPVANWKPQAAAYSAAHQTLWVAGHTQSSVAGSPSHLVLWPLAWDGDSLTGTPARIYDTPSGLYPEVNLAPEAQEHLALHLTQDGGLLLWYSTPRYRSQVQEGSSNLQALRLNAQGVALKTYIWGEGKDDVAGPIVPLGGGQVRLLGVMQQDDAQRPCYVEVDENLATARDRSPQIFQPLKNKSGNAYTSLHLIDALTHNGRLVLCGQANLEEGTGTPFLVSYPLAGAATANPEAMILTIGDEYRRLSPAANGPLLGVGISPGQADQRIFIHMPNLN